MAERGVRVGRGLGALVVAIVSFAGALTPVHASSTGTPGVVAADAPVVAAALDHSSRRAIRTAFNTVLKPTVQVPIGWTGNVDGCIAGAPSAAAQDATLTAVNFYRGMADLPPVSFDAQLSTNAQAAALLMMANGGLTHLPSPESTCYSAAAADGASHSNLTQGSTGAGAIVRLMADGGAGNNAVGHRRWILFPPQVAMGHGATSSFDALYVAGPMGSRPSSAPLWSAWPAAGYFPAQIEPTGRWSLSRAGADFTNAAVTVSRGGTPLTVTKQTVFDGLGDNTLVWELAPGFTFGGPDQLYTVTVTGVLPAGSTTRVTYSYVVRLFDADLDTPTAPTNVTASAGIESAAVSWGAPASSGSSAITAYVVTASPSGRTCRTSGALTCTVTGLLGSVPQTFTVAALTSVGIGDASAATAPVTPRVNCGSVGIGPFLDVPGTHPFCADIAWAASSGISTGFPDGTFLPVASVTRESMAAFLYRFAGSPAFTPPSTASFTDVPLAHPFFKEIEWLASKGITKGYPDGTFGARLAVTRQSMAAFLYRVAGSPVFVPPAVATFTDVPTTRAFYAEIEWMVANGIAGGFTDGTFRAEIAVSRQATVAFLHRLAPKLP